MGGNINEIVSLVLKDKNTPENIELIKNTYQPLYDDSPKEKSVPFDGVNELLEYLQDNGALLAINSNRTTESIKHFTDQFLSDIDFLLIEGHNENYPSKPSPIGVNKIIDKSGVSSDEVIYIGDSITDIKTAKNAGVDCVIVTWGYGFDDAYQHEYPVSVVDEVSQLYGIWNINYF